MSQNHRYILQREKSLNDKGTCPSCNEKRKLTKYIDTATNDYLDDHVGRCDRSDSCGYHFTPSDFFKENPKDKPLDFEKWKPLPTPPPRPISFIDNSVFKQSLGLNYSNTFTNFLIALFGKQRAENLVNRYHIGTTKNGEAIFYQVDLQGNVRSGKVMAYNITESTQTASGRDCRRDKSINPNWVHSKLKLENFNLKQCLFGEHLLTDNRTVAIVESAKSAVISSLYFGQYVWLSCEGKEGLSLDKLKVLKGLNIVLFPDLGGFEKWNLKAIEMRAFCKSVVVSDLLEKLATDADRASGLDLADYLLQLPAPEPSSTVTTDTQSCVSVNNEVVKPEVIVIYDTPFEDVANCDTSLTPFEIRAKVVIEWIMEHGKIFNGNSEMKNNLVKNIRLVESSLDDNEALQALSILEGVKISFGGN